MRPRSAARSRPRLWVGGGVYAVKSLSREGSTTRNPNAPTGGAPSPATALLHAIDALSRRRQSIDLAAQSLGMVTAGYSTVTT
jgi:hypothetical protein